MTDSLIVARALLRLGPCGRPAHRTHTETKLRGRDDERSSHSSAARPQDPWRTGAARAAFAIWATEVSRSTDTRADKTRR